MLQIQYFLSSPLGEAALPPAPVNPPVQPGRKRLRLYLVGSEADAQHAVDTLHVLGFAERFEWTQVIDLPSNGFAVYPYPGDVLRYLRRDMTGQR
ncbi:hypothetical protein [Pseudanabaena sp. FACHB-2040]|uniref:hypothetical protein n=1 Tax=Pseudanabaena sp. FACHB-2040 TaxID=2692859 RepID=UPI0016841F54|nr:hypothetical protein [Pseudanabaena sp. FACHB-2040]MBD2259470.1 hypothetical protein [Pseudanabaena sp. FACHB-2040]